MPAPRIPRGFVMIYTDTHSICMRVDHIVQIAQGIGHNNTLQIVTRDGETYKASYVYEDFLNMLSEAMESNDEK